MNRSLIFMILLVLIATLVRCSKGPVKYVNTNGELAHLNLEPIEEYFFSNNRNKLYSYRDAKSKSDWNKFFFLSFGNNMFEIPDITFLNLFSFAESDFEKMFYKGANPIKYNKECVVLENIFNPNSNINSGNILGIIDTLVRFQYGEFNKKREAIQKIEDITTFKSKIENMLSENIDSFRFPDGTTPNEFIIDSVGVFSILNYFGNLLEENENIICFDLGHSILIYNIYKIRLEWRINKYLYSPNNFFYTN